MSVRFPWPALIHWKRWTWNYELWLGWYLDTCWVFWGTPQKRQPIVCLHTCREHSVPFWHCWAQVDWWEQLVNPESTQLGTSRWYRNQWLLYRCISACRNCEHLHVWSCLSDSCCLPRFWCFMVQRCTAKARSAGAYKWPTCNCRRIWMWLRHIHHTSALSRAESLRFRKPVFCVVSHWNGFCGYIFIYIICIWLYVHIYMNILNLVPVLSECEWKITHSLQIVTASLQADKIQVAQRVQQLYSFDIDQEMVSSTRQRCSDLRLFAWAAFCGILCAIVHHFYQLLWIQELSQCQVRRISCCTEIHMITYVFEIFQNIENIHVHTAGKVHSCLFGLLPVFSFSPFFRHWENLPLSDRLVKSVPSC